MLSSKMMMMIKKDKSLTSYSNPGGTGDRRGSISVIESGNLLQYSSGFTRQNLLDGNTTNTGVCWKSPDQPVAGKWLLFTFLGPKLITEATWYQSAGNSPAPTFKFQGSNDGTTYTEIGGNFTITSQTTIITTLSVNTTYYNYYRMLGVSGNGDSTPWIHEITFKIA
jgi:hypothetical protein